MIALEFDFPKICDTPSLQSHRSFITTSGQELFEHSREFLPFGPQPCRLNDCATDILTNNSLSNGDGERKTSLHSKGFRASLSRKLGLEQKKKGMRGEGEGSEGNAFSLVPSPSPFHFFFAPALTFAL